MVGQLLVLASILPTAAGFLISTAVKAPACITRSRGVVCASVADGGDPRIKVVDARQSGMEMPKFRERPRQYRGRAFVLKDNIDTDQIIPAEFLTLVPSKVDEYEQLGSHALCGLPDDLYTTRFVTPGERKTEYPIIIGGQNFGCGSSREHAPIAMGAAGGRVVVAESYARIFFRNCISTGELYPYECPTRICDEITTGDEVTVDLEKDMLINHSTGKEYQLQPLGDAGPVVEAGGLFPFAVKNGMINKVDA